MKEEEAPQREGREESRQEARWHEKRARKDWTNEEGRQKK